jgi:hypothetical protein
MDGFYVFLVLVALGSLALWVAILVAFFQAVGYLRDILARLDLLVGRAPSTERGPTTAEQAADLPKTTPSSRRPGYYPDPDAPEMERRWTGKEWALDPPRRRRR